MRKLAALIVAATVSVGLAGCGASPNIQACATRKLPPIVVDDSKCLSIDHQWYFAPVSELEDDDYPVIGEELDDDFWDKGHTSKRKKTPKTSTTKAPKTTTKAAPTR